MSAWRLMLAGLSLGFGASGCWAWGPQSLEAQAQRAWLDHPGRATLDAWARAAQAQFPEPDPLVVPESGLMSLQLGATSENLRQRLGPPTEGGGLHVGARWVWRRDGLGPVAADLGASPSLLRRLEVWAPHDVGTQSMIRVGDDARRVARKYGTKIWRQAWSIRGCEIWVVPQANAAFVLGPEGAKVGEPSYRRVLGLMVGGFGP